MNCPTLSSPPFTPVCRPLHVTVVCSEQGGGGIGSGEGGGRDASETVASLIVHCVHVHMPCEFVAYFYVVCLNTSLPILPSSCDAMGGAKLIIAKHVACHATKHSPDSRKQNMLSRLTGLGKGYCCILLPQIRPEGKVLSLTLHLKLHFAHTRGGLQMWWWHDVIAGSSAPISPIQNLRSQTQHEIASTGKQIIMVGRPEVLSQSLPSLRYRLSVVYQKSLNVSEQNCTGGRRSKTHKRLNERFLIGQNRTNVHIF